MRSDGLGPHKATGAGGLVTRTPLGESQVGFFKSMTWCRKKLLLLGPEVAVSSDTRSCFCNPARAGSKRFPNGSQMDPGIDPKVVPKWDHSGAHSGSAWSRFPETRLGVGRNYYFWAPEVVVSFGTKSCFFKPDLIFAKGRVSAEAWVGVGRNYCFWIPGVVVFLWQRWGSFENGPVWAKTAQRGQNGPIWPKWARAA